MDDITIRPATSADVMTIGALWERLASHHQILDPRLPKPANGGDELYAHRIGSQLDDAYHRILVAEYNGELVGYVLGMIANYMPDIFIAESIGFLADIFVNEAHRGVGIGKKLVSELQAWFKSRGIVTMEWSVAAHNTSAKAFWEHIGGKDLIIWMRLDL